MPFDLNLDDVADPRNAKALAAACQLAYLPAEQGAAAFKDELGMEAKFVSVDNTQAYVATNDKHLVVAFRGSEGPTGIDGLKDWLLTNALNLLIQPEGKLSTDFLAAGVGAKFHQGFVSAVTEVWSALFPLVEAEVKAKVDGRDLAALRLRDWRRKIAVVLQDDFLFDGTVAENIAFSRPRASREEIEQAARAANCEEFVRALPRGIDTTIGERGVKLSGGQRQRVAIARALLADAPVLLLDEATSSLDSESEGLVREALAELRRGRTVLVVAHRLSTVRSADQILVLEDGAIVERGSHDVLVARGGRYRELHDAQLGS